MRGYVGLNREQALARATEAGIADVRVLEHGDYGERDDGRPYGSADVLMANGYVVRAAFL